MEWHVYSIGFFLGISWGLVFMSGKKHSTNYKIKNEIREFSKWEKLVFENPARAKGWFLKSWPVQYLPVYCRKRPIWRTAWFFEKSIIRAGRFLKNRSPYSIGFWNPGLSYLTSHLWPTAPFFLSFLLLSLVVFFLLSTSLNRKLTPTPPNTHPLLRLDPPSHLYTIDISFQASYFGFYLSNNGFEVFERGNWQHTFLVVYRALEKRYGKLHKLI